MILSTNTSIDDLSLSLISITSNNGESHELQCNADQEVSLEHCSLGFAILWFVILFFKTITSFNLCVIQYRLTSF